MRDKYIELIKEYVRIKPEYKYLLDELKKEVISVGATPEEFDEAVKQIEGIPQAPVNTSSAKKEFQKIKYIKHKAGEKAKKAFLTSEDHAKKHPKLFLAISAVIMILTILPLLGSQKASQNVKLATKTVTSVPTKSTQQKEDFIPVVYANLQTVDPDKIFSIKSDNVHLTVTGKPKKEVMGFLPYWMIPKQDQINLQTLTSVSYFGLDVDGNGNVITKDNGSDSSGWTMWGDKLFDTFLRRAKNQDIKVYLTFKSFDDSNIESLSKSDTAQKNFIANAIYLINSKNLDGINIDFEYVGVPDDNVRDGFTRLITNLNAELKRQVPNATLTIDTYLVSGSDSGLFNVPILGQNSDAFVIMGYDMHTALGSPGPISAMGGDTNIIGYVQNYLEKVGPDKLILAVPYYGYDWPQDSQDQSTSKVNILPYAEIADASKNLKLSWDDTSQTPYYIYKDDAGISRIVHFDNVRSLGIKYDFINKKDLKGVGIWALGYDGQNHDLEKLLIDKFINQ